MIKRRFKELMELRGVKTAYQLHKLTGISESGLKKIIEGNTNGIDFETLNQLCEKLNCQPNDLIVYEKNEEGK